MAMHDSTVPTLDGNPDAELIVLGLELEDTCRFAKAYREAHWEEDIDWVDIPGTLEADDIARRIVKLRATTLEGLRVKGKALHWFGGPIGPDDDALGIEDKIIYSLAADVAAISEPPPTF